MSANFLSPGYFYSLRVSAVLDHFGYPDPRLDQWQQCIWYDLGATQEVLHQMHIRLSWGLPAIAILLLRMNSLRPLKVGAQPPAP